MSERPVFDPHRVRVPAGERVDALPPATLTPRAVNELVRGALAAHVPSTIHVLGEIGDFSRPQSGHIYFSLKDATSELRCVMWRSTAARLRFAPEPGMEVIATGRLEVYLPRGVYQLVVRKLEPRGVGALEIAFRQLKDRLEREGLFDPARKRPLPLVPQRIAVVTSPRGAAIRDIVQTLARRFPAAEVLVFPVRVQGDGAGEEIARAIDLLNRFAAKLGGIDVAIVGRGGGSLEDLWAFNEEVVARAIARSRVPIISAVGHEVDVSIADLVADVRAATPTAAAEMVAPRLDDLLDRIDEQVRRARRAVVHGVELARGRLRAQLAGPALSQPGALLRERAQQIDECLHRLGSLVVASLRSARETVVARQMELLRFGSGRHYAELGQRLAHQVFRLRRAAERAQKRADRDLAKLERRAQGNAPGQRLARLDERLAGMGRRLARATPEKTRTRCEERLAGARRRLDGAIAALLDHRRRVLDGVLDRAVRAHPHHILARGYSITRDARTRRLIRSIEQIRDGQRVITELADGQFRSTADDPRQPRLFE